jgi:hypothetical protein
MSMIDNNPFFGRDLDLVPSEDVFQREVLFEKTKSEFGSIQGEVLQFDNFADGTIVKPNSIYFGNMNDSVGGYDISGNKGERGSMNFIIDKKPNWFRRTMIKILFGWDWIDKEE